MTKHDLDMYICNQIVAEQMKERIETLRDKMYSLQSIVIDGQPKAAPVITGGKHEDMICDYMLLIEDYEALQTKCNTLCHDIEKAFDKLPADENAIMREHYINGESWDTVAERYNWSRRKVYYLRDSALSSLGIK